MECLENSVQMKKYLEQQWNKILEKAYLKDLIVHASYMEWQVQEKLTPCSEILMVFILLDPLTLSKD